MREPFLSIEEVVFVGSSPQFGLHRAVQILDVSQCPKWKSIGLTWQVQKRVLKLSYHFPCPFNLRRNLWFQLLRYGNVLSGVRADE